MSIHYLFTWFGLFAIIVSHIAQAEEAVPVKICPLQKQTVNETVTAWGKLNQDAQQLYFEVDGYLNEINAKTGQTVAKDQVLARLDQVLLENQRQQAQVSLSYAQKQLTRISQLKRNKAVGQDQLDEAQSNHALKALALADVEEKLAKVVLRAPAAGKILNRLIDFPLPISAGTPLFSFKAQDEPWLATVNVAARHLHKMHMGDAAKVTLSAFPQQVLDGTIHKIAENVVSADNLYEVEVALTNAPDFLRAGMQVKAQLTLGTHKGYVVPLNAFYRITGQEGILFMFKQATGKASRVTVAFSFVNGTDAIVSTDLSQFSAVIVAGQMHLKEGALVEVLGD